MTAHDLKRTHRRSALRRRRVVAVIGSGTMADHDACRQVGRLVAELDCDLLTGAGGGVMEEVSRAFAERRDELGGAGIAIGIVPGSVDDEGRYTARSGYPNPWVELAVYTHLPRSGEEGVDMLSRNHINMLSADAVVALAGGPGTQSEIALALRYRIPLIAYGRSAHGGFDHAAHIDGVREFLITQLSEP
jgi:uncharacterized protein (TIGR00725 family)